MLWGGGGGKSSFTPTKRGKDGNDFSPDERGEGGGGTHIFGVVLKQVLAVLTMLKGERKNFPPFKRGDVLPCLCGGVGGGAKCFGPAIFPFFSPPPLLPRN